MPYEELIDLLISRNALIVHCSRPGKGDEGLDGRLFPDDLRDAITVCANGAGDVSCSLIWPGHSKTFGSIGIVLKPRSTASITSAQARIERGFIRAEDEAPEPEAAEDGETVIDGVRVNGDGEIIEDGNEDGGDVSEPDAEVEDAEEDGKPLSDSLIRDLTAHRTMALRLALGEQPDMALVAVVHTLAAQTFYRGGSEAHCLEIRPTSNYLAAHADGIEDTAAAKMVADGRPTCRAI